ncbi:hypothetical protein ACFY30_27755 [Streptomyces sp. NPDC000345]|uniref:hypothetical protein n=1 Tax=Streptomyces sp. NPDC000345 TaxID=3364537 RepID=UPI0036C0BE8D
MSTTAAEHSAPHSYVDFYAVEAPDVLWPEPAGPRVEADQPLPPPNPAERLCFAVSPRDQRRIGLHAALTASGIPPRPEDRDAIDQLSALPDGVNAVLRRWLHHTA